MYYPNTAQIPWKDASEKRFKAWVIFVYGNTNERYQVVHDAAAKLFTSLGGQGVYYAEITTESGQRGVRTSFDCMAKQRPLFLILNKHPKDYQARDPFLVIEWGKWRASTAVGDDAHELASSFSDGEFPSLLDRMRERSIRADLQRFLNGHAFVEMRLGVNFSAERFPG